MSLKNSDSRQAAVQAHASVPHLSVLPDKTKKTALNAMAASLLKSSALILKANARDVSLARKKGLPEVMIARLVLDTQKIRKIAGSLRDISKLQDPVGRTLEKKKRPNGLLIQKISVPMGVILIIYEARPNVTADCMALCLKSGNAVILKGGSEALETNRALFRVLNEAAIRAGVPKGSFQFVATSDRNAVKELLSMSDLIDLVIPRGGEGLIRHVAEISKIPVIKHYKGVCHVYADKDADQKKAVRIVVNGKTQNPSVCNATECLLVHEKIAKAFLSQLEQAPEMAKVELRGDTQACSIVPRMKKAKPEDWGAEYLDLILAVRVVKDMNEAIHHIDTYGSHHSDAIVTRNKKTSEEFKKRVDSSAVFVNCSTRFNDGGEFGMGAEMGISTDKLHARGPMGLKELTSYKYVVEGDGQIRG